MSLKRTMVLLPVALALVACTAAPAATPTSAPPTAAPTAAPTATPEPTDAPTAVPATPSPVADVCAKENLALKNPGRLTLSTDNPAFPPWWGGDPDTQYPNEPEGGSGWEVSDPYSSEGFEGAVAYAIAEAMGFTAEEVDWLQNAVFEQAFAPGEKAFDFHMAQISIRPERAAAVDFTEPYFDSNQSLLAMTVHPVTGESPNPITSAVSIEDLRGYTLGAAANTTSFELIENGIQPTTEVMVYPDNSAAKTALQNGQIEGLVVDLGTAFYIRDAELENYDTPDPESRIVGQFGPLVQVDQVGAVLEKDSALTDCVNAAIAQIKADGTLEAILDQWINTGQEIRFLE